MFYAARKSVGLLPSCLVANKGVFTHPPHSTWLAQPAEMFKLLVLVSAEFKECIQETVIRRVEHLAGFCSRRGQCLCQEASLWTQGRQPQPWTHQQLQPQSSQTSPQEGCCSNLQEVTCATFHLAWDPNLYTLYSCHIWLIEVTCCDTVLLEKNRAGCADS